MNDIHAEYVGSTVDTLLRQVAARAAAVHLHLVVAEGRALEKDHEVWILEDYVYTAEVVVEDGCVVQVLDVAGAVPNPQAELPGLQLARLLYAIEKS